MKTSKGKEMKMITTKLIESFKPCQDRLDNWLSHYKSFSGDVLQFLDLKNITHNDKLWIFLRLLPKEYLGSIAADFAEEVVHIYERYNPDSSVLKAAIAAARGNDIAAARNAANAIDDVYIAVIATYKAAIVARAIDAAKYTYTAARAAASAAEANYAAVRGNDANDTNAYLTAAYAANAAVDAADNKDDMENKQVEIMKKWFKKIKKDEK
jgi:hypothetical protein